MSSLNKVEMSSFMRNFPPSIVLLRGVMKELLTMNKKELDRCKLMYSLQEKTISQLDVAERLGITTRQVRRLKTLYLTSGAEGLISKKRGRPSNRRLPIKFKARVMSLIFKYYKDYGPTLAQEKLEEKHQVKLSVESLRQWMIEAEIWKDKIAKKPVIHQMRPRRSRYGELVQIDGSPHDWFEGRGPSCTLLVYIDDATGCLGQLLFIPTETTEGYFKATRAYVEKHGRPQAFYSDKYCVFRVNQKGVETGDGMTEFGRLLKRLEIELICANTPQAKGRVEKANQTLQDRLVKEMREKGISTMEEANEYAPKFIEKFNKKFGVEPRLKEDMHRALDKEKNTEEIFSYYQSRSLSKNLGFQYKNTLYQVQSNKMSYGLRKATVTILEDLNGKIKVTYKGKKLEVVPYGEREDLGKIVASKEIDPSINWITKRHKPDMKHPWR